MKHTWQTCPKCGAEGTVFPKRGGTSSSLIPCDVCRGEKILSKETGLPPSMACEVWEEIQILEKLLEDTQLGNVPDIIQGNAKLNAIRIKRFNKYAKFEG
jgi:hypothetical protein